MPSSSIVELRLGKEWEWETQQDHGAERGECKEG